MKPLNLIVTLLLSLAMATPAVAAGMRPLSPEAIAALPAMKPDAAKATTTNPNRIYPPSCLSAPLPTQPRGQALQGTGSFLTAIGTKEPATLTIWREPCGATKSALLVRVDRQVAAGAAQTIFLPAVGVAPISPAPSTMTLRLAEEPNTELSDAAALSRSSISETYVLDVAVGPLVDINRELLVQVVSTDSSQVVQPFLMPQYDPSRYPDAALPAKISGHMTGPYSDSAKPGEGVGVEVVEIGTVLFFVFTWYTYDDDGFPVWLFGGRPFQPGDRAVTVDLDARVGGRLAGNFDPAAVRVFPWGRVTVEFPSCKQIRFAYQSTHNTQGLPIGSGERTWTRSVDINKLACE
ncbi:MAG: hypothetical protein LKM32_14480 [Chiayiivirga sp.]|jgi:hypothetical protein|uniref:hypothetical protein n=1 Tax=Chiayiivirga sp. TaxID=2041042 RepID=UPI0025BAAAF4|nr:hypothetical protein [Chiayiivirga sp.]MCI1711509.1 hypothetical protein [Chiayiivirga sp.]MCI1730535.1 hypothetical protein [Chiayiivirga sp.]